MKWDCRNRIKTSTSRLPIPYTNPKKFYLLDHFEHINIKENWKSIWILDPYGKLSQTNMDPLALKNCNKSYLRGGKKLSPFSRKKKLFVPFGPHFSGFLWKRWVFEFQSFGNTGSRKWIIEHWTTSIVFYLYSNTAK